MAVLVDTLRIPIHERVELPEELIPADSRVEIDAKITAGEFGNRVLALGSMHADTHDIKATSQLANE